MSKRLHVAVQRDPYPHYRRLRDEAPVYLIEPLQAYALTRYDDCKNTFLHPELYSAKDLIEQAFGARLLHVAETNK